MYVTAPNGRKLDLLYQQAWQSGCKTTYYLRSAAASHVEKSTLQGTDGKLNAVVPTFEVVSDAQACAIDNPECEACQ